LRQIALAAGRGTRPTPGLVGQQDCAPARAVAPDAAPLDRLVAQLGRDPHGMP
jgi:hypothetical protein